MSLQFDFSHLTNSDLVTLAIALALILLLFLFLIYTQRKHIAQMFKASSYQVDVDRYEQQGNEAAQHTAQTRENIAQVKQALGELDAEDTKAQQADGEER